MRHVHTEKKKKKNFASKTKEHSLSCQARPRRKTASKHQKSSTISMDHGDPHGHRQKALFAVHACSHFFGCKQQSAQMEQGFRRWQGKLSCQANAKFLATAYTVVLLLV